MTVPNDSYRHVADWLVDETQNFSASDGDRCVVEEVRALATEFIKRSGQRDDLAMLCRRLLRKHPDEKLKEHSLDYLKRQELLGSILR